LAISIVTIKVADNGGFVVTTHEPGKRLKGGGRATKYQTNAFVGTASLKKFIEKALG